MMNPFDPVGLITASRHWTTLELHSLPHRTTDVIKTLRKDPGRKAEPHRSKPNYIGHTHYNIRPPKSAEAVLKF